MILQLNKLEVSHVLISMSIMRKNVKKVLKRNYNKKESKENLSKYDEVKDVLKTVIEEEKENVLLAAEKVNVMYSFLITYLEKLEAMYKESSKSIVGEDKEHVDILKNIVKRIEEIEHAA